MSEQQKIRGTAIVLETEAWEDTAITKLRDSIEKEQPSMEVKRRKEDLFF